MPVGQDRFRVARGNLFVMSQDEFELIIVDDGRDPVQDLVPDDPRIRAEPLWEDDLVLITAPLAA